MDISDFLKRAGQTKQDLLSVFGQEWRGFLEAFFADSTLEIHARIKLIPSDKKKGIQVNVVSKDVKIHNKKRTPQSSPPGEPKI